MHQSPPRCDARRSGPSGNDIGAVAFRARMSRRRSAPGGGLLEAGTTSPRQCGDAWWPARSNPVPGCRLGNAHLLFTACGATLQCYQTLARCSSKAATDGIAPRAIPSHAIAPHRTWIRLGLNEPAEVGRGWICEYAAGHVMFRSVPRVEKLLAITVIIGHPISPSLRGRRLHWEALYEPRRDSRGD
jgi:hypothetical protein